MKNWKSKDCLLKIREAKRRVEVLRRRIELDDTDELQKELSDSEQELKCVTVGGMDLVSRLQDTSQQAVMIRRYVDLQSWEEIAAGMAMTVRAVQKIHGRALPLLEEVLLREAS